MTLHKYDKQQRQQIESAIISLYQTNNDREKFPFFSLAKFLLKYKILFHLIKLG